jgi:hypothetical protein
MEEATAESVVELLRQRRIFASVNRRVGVYNVGVRVVIPDGREAIWDNDGAAGLEAMVLRDGMLVGFVPQLPDSEDLDAAAIAHIISEADYDAPVAASPAPVDSPPAASATPQPATPASAPPASTAPASMPPASMAPGPAPSGRGWRDLFRRR